MVYTINGGIMSKKYMLCLDGDKDIEFNNGFYFHNIRSFYENNGFTVKRVSVGTENELSEIIEKYNRMLSDSEEKDTIYLISGSFMGHIIGSMKSMMHNEDLETKFGELSRVYSQVNLKYQALNLYLSEGGRHNIYDLKSVAASTINSSFDFRVLDVKNRVLSEVYKEIIAYIKAKGWISPAPLY